MINNVLPYNAIDALKIIVSKRMWHEGRIEASTATVIKQRLLKGGLSYEAACKTLNTLGYEKVEEEVWEKK